MQVACPNKDCPWRPARTYVNKDRTARGVAGIRDGADTVPQPRFSGEPLRKRVLRMVLDSGTANLKLPRTKDVFLRPFKTL